MRRLRQTQSQNIVNYQTILQQAFNINPKVGPFEHGQRNKCEEYLYNTRGQPAASGQPAFRHQLD
jgi:hypothetical protein